MVKYPEQENQLPVTTALMDGIIEIEFQKADGSLRKMKACLLYTSPSPRDRQKSRMPSSA